LSELSTESQRTSLYDQHAALGARFVDFFGWEMPLLYEGQLKEHEAVRNDAGIFDVSHMGQARIVGKDALAFVNFLVPGNFSAVTLGGAKYTMLCNADGGVIDDLIITRVGESEFFAVINASRIDVDIAWMQKQAEAFDGEAEVINESDSWSMIAVQGPKSIQRLIDIGILPGDYAGFRPFSLQAYQQEEKTYLVSKTGYTGEIGCEILCPNADAEYWWNQLIENKFTPCGLAARDSLRLEAGYCLYGQDLNEDTTPVEAGLSWTVGWKKEGDFLGKETLVQQKKDGVEKQLVGFVSESKRPIRPHDKILFNDREVGIVTSGGYSPELKCGIALGYVFARPESETSEGWSIKGKGSANPVKLSKPPFVSTSLGAK